MLQGYGVPTSLAQHKAECDEIARAYRSEREARHASLHAQIDDQLMIVKRQLDCLLWPESRKARLHGGLIKHPEITVREFAIRKRPNGILTCINVDQERFCVGQNGKIYILTLKNNRVHEVAYHHFAYSTHLENLRDSLFDLTRLLRTSS